MSELGADRFWLSRRAWVYALIEGLRVAAIIAITLFCIRGAGWIFRTEKPLAGWLIGAATMALVFAIPAFMIFAIWTRVDTWRNNRVKPK